MGLRRRELALGSAVRRLRGPSGVPGTGPVPETGPDEAHTILTITDDAGIAIVTTAAPHGLTEGLVVTISGTSEAAYNTTADVGPTTATTFNFLLGYTADSTGGTWALA